MLTSINVDSNTFKKSLKPVENQTFLNNLVTTVDLDNNIKLFILIKNVKELIEKKRHHGKISHTY